MRSGKAKAAAASNPSDFDPRSFVEGMEALGFEVKAWRNGDASTWFWGRRGGIKCSDELTRLLAPANASDENSDAVLAYLIASGRVLSVEAINA